LNKLSSVTGLSHNGLLINRTNPIVGQLPAHAAAFLKPGKGGSVTLGRKRRKRHARERLDTFTPPSP
jgi:hypothetical protein